MVLVLAARGPFVYLRLESDLDESVTAGLAARAAAVLAAGSPRGGRGRGGRGGLRAAAERRTAACSAAPAASAARRSARAELRRAAAGEKILVERRVPGVEGTTRVLARARRRLGGRRGRPVARRPRRDARQPRGVLRARRSDRRRRSRPCSATRWPPPGCDPSRRCAAARRTSRSAATTSGCRCPRPTTRSAASGETLNEMLDRLRRSFERERRFVADASHELRTPVAVIKAELEAALRAGGHDPQVREALVAARRGVRSPRAAGRGPAGRRAHGRGRAAGAARAARRCASCSTGVARRFADRAGERGRTISVDAGDGRSVYADELRLRQALGNLVDNALRHGAGEIVLRARRAAGPASSSRSPTRARGSRPASPSAPSSASRAAISPAPATAPASASRSCGRSPRRTAARAEVVAGRRRDGADLAPRPPRHASGSSQIAGVASSTHPTNEEARTA